jgi:hypothetical protein
LPNKQDITNEFGIGLGIEGGGMAFEVTTLDSSNPNYPAALLPKKGQAQFPRISIIGGFHTPIEKDCLDLLLRGKQPVVICPARDIKNMRLGKDLKTCVEEGRVLVLSPFEGMGRRPTAQVSERRNRFVGILAMAAFIAYANPGGRTEAFAKEFIGLEKPLYTFETQYNKSILEIGAKPVDPRILTQWAGSLNALAVETR